MGSPKWRNLMSEVDVYLHEPAEGYCLCFYFGESPILDDEEKLTRVIQTGERLVVGWGGQSKPSSVASPRKVKMDISKLGQGTFPYGDNTTLWVLQAPRST